MPQKQGGDLGSLLTQLAQHAIELNRTGAIDQIGGNILGDPRMTPEVIAAIIKGLQGRQVVGPPQQNGLYWDARHPSAGGTGQIVEAPNAPDPGYYRLVDSPEEARAIASRGEVPLFHPLLGTNLDPSTLLHEDMAKLQEQQYAAPGGAPMFSFDNGQFTVDESHPGWSRARD